MSRVALPGGADARAGLANEGYDLCGRAAGHTVPPSRRKQNTYLYVRKMFGVPHAKTDAPTGPPALAIRCGGRVRLRRCPWARGRAWQGLAAGGGAKSQGPLGSQTSRSPCRYTRASPCVRLRHARRPGANGAPTADNYALFPTVRGRALTLRRHSVGGRTAATDQLSSVPRVPRGGG